jgi:hypothetical protein
MSPRTLVRPQNLLTWSEFIDLAHGYYPQTAGTVITSASTDVPLPLGFGTGSVSKIAYDGSGTAGNTRIYKVTTMGGLGVVGNTYLIAAWLRTLSGSVPLRLSVGPLQGPTITVTPSWQRVFCPFVWTTPGAGVFWALSGAVGDNSALTVYATGAQVSQYNSLCDYVKTLGTAANVTGAPRSLVL